MQEIDRADVSTRRKLLILLVACAVAGGLILAGFCRYHHSVQCWLFYGPSYSQRLQVTCLLVALFLTLPVAGLMIYLWRTGSRTMTSERFPPPGIRILRNTVVLHGPEAVRQGHLFKVMAVGLAVLAAGILVVWLRLACLLIR